MQLTNQPLRFVSYSDPHLAFYGKWEEEGDRLTSYGTRCALRFYFRGDCVIFSGHFSGSITLLVDGEAIPFPAEDNTGITGLEPGEHSLILSTRGEGAVSLQGILCREILPLGKLPLYLKFIGDSITHAAPGFPEPTAGKLGAEYSVDAVCGMSLVNGWGWPKELPDKIGMEDFYFSCRRTREEKTGLPCSFRYDMSPDAVIIFLGTNDYLDSPEDKEAGNIGIFAGHYAAFVEKLAMLYPKAPFFILEPLSDKYCRQEGIEAGFALMEKHLGDRVILLPSHTWNIALSPDGTHPSEEGYATLEEKLPQALASGLLPAPTRSNQGGNTL